MLGGAAPYDYLIIVYDDFYSSILDLADWKVAIGFGVEITITSEIPDGGDGLDPGDIRDYIKAEYEAWGISYVLLVGDVEHIPTYYYQGATATDHYYSDVDYLPDHEQSYFSELFVGRIPVKNSSELDVIVNKIVTYEQSPYTEGSDWYKKALLISDSGYFEVTSNWVYEFLTYEGYTINKIYKSLGNDDPANVTNSINDGRAIVNYRGHGAVDGWQTSSFLNGDVLALENGRKLPIVISPTCNTGWFDYQPSDCFGEIWLKGDTSEFPGVNGAVAFFGSSRPSYGGYNDELDKGFYKAVFDDDLPYFAQATNKAKVYMYNSMGDDSMTRLEFRLFNNFGDPSLCMFDLCPPIPRAYDGIASTEIDTPAEIHLKASDNGLPIPPGALTYIVTSLPSHGTLSEPAIGVIASVPYSLVNNGNEVIYMPYSGYSGPDSFKFKAYDGGTPPDGGYSDEATINVNVFEVVNWWKLDESTGQIAEDSIGDSNGIVYGAQWTTGQIGGALVFDGYDDYIGLGTLEALTGASVTISAWIKAYNASASYSPIVRQSGFEGSDYLGYNLFVVTGVPCFLLNEFSTEWTGDEINSNEWYHLAGTYDSERLRIYLDGVLKGSSTRYPAKSGWETGAYIGYEVTAEEDYYFHGIIDDVQVYNGAMDVDEIMDKMFYGTSKFAILNEVGVRVAWFDDLGNLFLKGSLTMLEREDETRPSASSEDDEFIVQDSTGNLAVINGSTGDMEIWGYLKLDSESEWVAPDGGEDEFIIRNDQGNPVAYIDELGDVYLKGQLYVQED